MQPTDTSAFETFFGCLFILVIFAAIGWIWWRIMGKTGHHPALGLLMIVPLANVVVLLWLALSEWPIHKRIKDLESGKGLLDRFE